MIVRDDAGDIDLALDAADIYPGQLPVRIGDFNDLSGDT